eukprot:499890-Prorocentrum_minimum.AAC.1
MPRKKNKKDKKEVEASQVAPPAEGEAPEGRTPGDAARPSLSWADLQSVLGSDADDEWVSEGEAKKEPPGTATKEERQEQLEAHCYQACLARLYALRRIRDASDRLAPMIIPKLWPNRHWRNVGPTERRGIYELLLHKGDEEILELFHIAAMFFFDDKFEQWVKDLQDQKEIVRLCFEALSEEVGGPRQLPDEYPVEVV